MQKRLMFMFPGVGSHYSGMGKTFYREFRLVRDLFTEASDVLHCDVSELCFVPERATELDLLENAQVVLLCISVAMYRVLVMETGLEQAIYLGYSLGEYSALCCAGALDFRDALLLVRERGRIVADVSAMADGTMAWAVNIPRERVEQICAEARLQGEEVFVSAYDTPLKTSISGTRVALHQMGERIVAAGGIALPIKMSGPFHCPLMGSASEKFSHLLGAYHYTMPRFPVIANFTARPYAMAEEIPKYLALQLVNPIRWQDSLEYVFNQSVMTSIEIGPKNILTYLLEKNRQNIDTYVIDTTQSLRKIREHLLVRRDDYLHFLARCLTTIVGTKNYNDNEQDYQEKVIVTFRSLQSIYDDIQSETLNPDRRLSQSILAMLHEALQAKRMPEAEIVARIKRVSGEVHDE